MRSEAARTVMRQLSSVGGTDARLAERTEKRRQRLRTLDHRVLGQKYHDGSVGAESLDRFLTRTSVIEVTRVNTLKLEAMTARHDVASVV